tara:strand:- start:1564 stop:2508 length:945 start_codon:yes stop_codon:yes gene_type:complete
MPKFFQSEIAGYDGAKNKFQNVKFKKRDFINSSAAQSGAVLEIIPVHIKNPPIIQFLAYVSTLGDSYNVQYKSEQPFGRNDRYHVWQGNSRTMNLGFTIPSSSISKGLDNLNNLSWLLASLYPSYKDSLSATSVSASPLFRVRYANLIMSTAAGGVGALCVIRSVRVAHDHREGFIGAVPAGMAAGGGNTAGSLIKSAGFDNIVREGERILIPKVIKLTVNMEIINDFSAGWDHQTGNWRGGHRAPGFPYKFGLVRDTQDYQSASETGRVQEDAAVNTADNSALPGSPEAQQSQTGTTVINDTSANVGIEQSNI